MHVIADPQTQTYRVTPVTFGERMVVRRHILPHVKVGDVLSYHGRHGEPEHPDFNLRFNLGGERCEVKSRAPGGTTFIQTGYRGGVTFRMRGTRPEDRAVLSEMRDMCFFGSGGLVITNIEDGGESEPTLECAGVLCKHCQKPVGGLQAQHKVCPECAKKCVHEWEESAAHGYDIGSIAVADVCTKCGSVSKASLKKVLKLTPIERQALAMDTFGMHITIDVAGLKLSIGEAMELQNWGVMPKRYVIAMLSVGVPLQEVVKRIERISKRLQSHHS